MTAMTGRDAFLNILQDEGVSILFGNPGTTELPIMDALADKPNLRYVLGLQEAIVTSMADGYARASGQLAAANVHVAPGLGNALGSLYSAKFYGSPLIITAGQQDQGHSLSEPLLYHSLVAMAEPLVKWATEVHRVEDLPLILRRAAKVALTPPTGPVFISLPGDVLNASAELELGRVTRVDAASRPSDEALQRLARRLLEARAPVIMAGHEVCTSDAFAEVAAVAELLGARVYLQTVPYTAQFPTTHPLYMGYLSRDQAATRRTLEEADLLLAVGSDVFRMSMPSPVDPLPAGLPVLQIGLRDWELGKNYPAEIALKCDVRQAMGALAGTLAALRSAAQRAAAERRAAAARPHNWSARREALLAKTQQEAHAVPITPNYLMARIAAAIPPGGIIVDEGLTTSRSLLDVLTAEDRQRYYGLASGGIGWGLPGAIGVHLALPERPMIAISGDGSAMYSIQALWTAAHLQAPITFVIANNGGYRILKERLFAYRGKAVAHERFIGMDLKQPRIDFTALAGALGVPARHIDDPAELESALRAGLQSPGPNLLDVAVYDGYRS